MYCISLRGLHVCGSILYGGRSQGGFCVLHFSSGIACIWFDLMRSFVVSGSGFLELVDAFCFSWESLPIWALVTIRGCICTVGGFVWPKTKLVDICLHATIVGSKLGDCIIFVNPFSLPKPNLIHPS